MVGLSQAQSHFDNTGYAGTNLTLRQELEIEQAEKDFWTGLVEELESDEFSPSLMDLRGVFPTASQRELKMLHNQILNRVADARERVRHGH
jgi:hypothetical protein